MSQRMDYTAVSPDGMKALGGLHQYVFRGGLSKQLLDLVFLRVSQINGCAYCVGKHSSDLLRDGMAIEKLVLVPDWREAGELFDPRERASLAWAEAVTWVAGRRVTDEDFGAAAAVFADKELADLTIAIGMMNTYNRMAISFGVPPEASAADQKRWPGDVRD